MPAEEKDQEGQKQTEGLETTSTQETASTLETTSTLEPTLSDDDFIKSSLGQKLLKQKQDANAEAVKVKKKLAAFEASQKEKERADELSKMEETDRLKAVAADAEGRLKAMEDRANRITKQASVISKAARMDFRNPSVVARIVSLDSITVDANGIPDEEQITLMLNELKENDSYLIKADKKPLPPEDFGGGPTNPTVSVDSVPMPKLHDPERIQLMRKQAADALGKGQVGAAVKLYNQQWEAVRGIKKKKPEGG